ncbi:MAG: sulfatase-like hydrolase/transferase [Coprococcus comes]
MKKPKIKSIGYGFYCILMIIISVLGFILYNLGNWVLDTWGLLSIDEIIFHLKVPLDGTNSDVVLDGINACVPLAVLVLFLSIFLIIGLRNKHGKCMIALFLVAVIACGSAGRAAYEVYDELDVKEYLVSQKKESHFIEQNYVDPRTTKITFPDKKRNLIYIYLESMESTFASKGDGGGLDFNCIPELTTLAEENTNFSNSDKLGGGYPAYGGTWTMAGIFSQTSGIPIKNSEQTDDVNATLAEQSSFSSQARNLEDILADEGYNQCFMIGSDATFGGRRAYFESHGKGQTEICDYNTAKENGQIPEDYYVWWGYEDQKLFANAQEKLTELSSKDEPFNFTMLTVDTHFEDGYVCEQCQNEFGDNQYANVMACSSRQVDAFVKWIQQQPFYENTTIVISGDHLTMDSDFCNDVSEDYERSVYNVFINLPEGLDTSFEKTHNREFATLDMFPTTLAAMGVTIEGDRLALGVNLFSDEQTLTEQYGRKGLDKELMKKSKFYDMLINDVDIDALQKKRKEEAEKQQEENADNQENTDNQEQQTNQPDAGIDTSGIETPDAWQGYTQDNYQYNYNDGSNDYWYDGGNSWDNSWNGGMMIMPRTNSNTGTDSSSNAGTDSSSNAGTDSSSNAGTGSSARADTNTRSGTGFNTNSRSRWRRRKQCRRNNRKCKLEKSSGLCRGFSSDK